jgi:hypothetical protein
MGSRTDVLAIASISPRNYAYAAQVFSRGAACQIMEWDFDSMSLNTAVSVKFSPSAW